MVCDSCTSRLSRVCVPDKWKDGARNTIGGGIRAGKTNKALAKKSESEKYIPQERACRICKSKVQQNMFYCNDCAHKKGWFTIEVASYI